MAATYYTAQGGDLFQRGTGGASSLVSIPALDGIIGESGLAIYSDVTVQLGETLQYFLTFDDVIKFIWFGKGLGDITVNGVLFSDCTGDLPGASQYFQAFGSLRGESTQITVGSQTFTAIVSNANLSIMAEPDTMAQFQLVFSVVDHQL